MVDFRDHRSSSEHPGCDSGLWTDPANCIFRPEPMNPVRFQVGKVTTLLAFESVSENSFKCYIRGAGKAAQLFESTRSANDPIGTLLADANGQPTYSGARHEHSLDGLQFEIRLGFDSYLSGVCHHLPNSTIEPRRKSQQNGQPLDSTESSVHDNTFLLRSTSYGHGDNALSVNRFNPAISVDRDAGVVRDNHFIQAGEYRSFSMLIVSESGLYVHSNVSKRIFRLRETRLASNLAQDNRGRLPDNAVKISNNTFQGASIVVGAWPSPRSVAIF